MNYSSYIDSLAPLLKSLMLNSKINKRFTNKGKMVPWFYSNMITPGRREDYAQEPDNSPQMDVYGNCGNITCKPPNGLECDPVIYTLNS